MQLQPAEVVVNDESVVMHGTASGCARYETSKTVLHMVATCNTHIDAPLDFAQVIELQHP